MALTGRVYLLKDELGRKVWKCQNPLSRRSRLHE